jgi:hypothetical protein
MKFFLILLFNVIFGLDNGLALTPPMGWNEWVQFRCEVNCTANPKTCVSEQLIVEMIDRLVSDGWLKAGYQYINIDDCWSSGERNSNGDITADTTRFPHGIEYLASYAHEKGVKLGITNTYGSKSCGGFTGSKGYLLRDAEMFAKWGIDYLKMTACNSNDLDLRDGYGAMHYFLNSTKRPIVYSCSWPNYDPDMDFAQLPPHCNLWRAYSDISSTWTSIKKIIDKWGDTPEWVQYAGPGHWNDPDQLVIGMTETSRISPISEAEARSQMSIWSIVAAPLIMSNDLRSVNETFRYILLNEEVIAINQDRWGQQGRRISGIYIYLVLNCNV